MKLIRWVKIIVSWLMVKSNRKRGLVIINKVIVILETVSKMTKNKHDDFMVKSAKRTIRKLIKDLPEDIAIDTIDKINTTVKGPMKDINIGFDKENGLNAGFSIKF